MRGFSDLVDRISTFVGKAASFLILLLVGVVMYEVLARYLFNAPTKWSNEISEYVLTGVVMLGGAFCLVNDGHVRVDILYRNFLPRTRALVELITCLIVLIFVSAMVWKGGELCYDALIHNKKSMTILELPLFPSMIMVPIGATLLGIQSLAKSVRALILLLGIGAPESERMYEV